MANRKVWLVYRQTDMTEGRGPMALDSAWETRELAENYSHSQEGVMGRKYNGGDYWDWSVKEMEVRTSAPTPQYRIRREALKKLTKQERQALGLEAPDAR